MTRQIVVRNTPSFHQAGVAIDGIVPESQGTVGSDPQQYPDNKTFHQHLRRIRSV